VTIHARTATHLGRPENMNACLRFLRDDVVPTILSMPRCVGLSVLADHRSGLCIITTAWETSEAMHASVARIRPLRDQTSKIMHSSVDLEEWQIAAMHRKHPAGTPVGAQVTWLRVDPGDTDATRARCDQGVLLGQPAGQSGVGPRGDHGVLRQSGCDDPVPPGRRPHHPRDGHHQGAGLRSRDAAPARAGPGLLLRLLAQGCCRVLPECG